MIAGLLLAAGLVPPVPPPAASGPPITVTARRGCGPRYAELYIAPMGEPSRTDGTTDPMAQWFAAADADHDGRLTWPEMKADADRFFARLDADRSGEIDPQEMAQYEYKIAPEIKLFQPDQDRRPGDRKGRREAREEARERADYQAPYGAGYYASLNVPEPVASADTDLNRGVSQKEYDAMAWRRFQMLDGGGQGYLTLAALPRSPEQQEIDACYAKAEKKRR